MLDSSASFPSFSSALWVEVNGNLGLHLAAACRNLNLDNGTLVLLTIPECPSRLFGIAVKTVMAVTNALSGAVTRRTAKP